MSKFLKNKKALSPLVATLLLLAFALVIGTATMNWGKSYVDKIEDSQPEYEPLKSAVVINIEDIDTPLKELQIKHVTGQISEEKYLEEEKGIIS
mgnify:CR=1 FL=1